MWSFFDSIILNYVGDEITGQPSQKYFDSILYHEIMKFDFEKTIWVESESSRIGKV